MLPLKILIFLKSLWFHIYAGFPKANIHEIADRYAICKSCDDFNSTESLCNICGCNISNQKIFLNKLAWADQECPKQKWLKITRR